MKEITPSCVILSPAHVSEGINLLKSIEAAARVSHKSEAAQKDDSYERFIKSVVIDHGDWSVVEHALARVRIRTDRGITHEIVRHRLFSFTQESTRFVNGRKSYPEGVEFVKPIALKNYSRWIAGCTFAEQQYLAMLDEGERPQEARSVLTTSTAATIEISGNLRNWRHFFIMRTSRESHPDMKRITVPLLGEFKQLIPILFDDICAEERQIDAMKRAR